MEKDSLIIRCLKCGQKNRLDSSRLDYNPVCGVCRSPLDLLIVQCFFCGAKNRISEDKLQDRPICGRCHLPLYRTSLNTVSDLSFKEDVLDFPGIVMVGCMISETEDQTVILNYFASKYAGGIKSLRLLVQENPDLAARYCLSESPALLIFSNGELTRCFTGILQRDEIEQYLVSLMKKPWTEE